MGLLQTRTVQLRAFSGVRTWMMSLSFGFGACVSSHGPQDAGAGGRDDVAVEAAVDAHEDVLDGGGDAPRWGRDAGMVPRRDSLFWLLAQPDGGSYDLPGQYVVLETDYEGRQMGAWAVPGATAERLGPLEPSVYYGQLTVASDHSVYVALAPRAESLDPRYPEFFLVRRLDPSAASWSPAGPPTFLSGGVSSFFPFVLPVVSDSGVFIGYRDRVPLIDEPPTQLFRWNGAAMSATPLTEPDGRPIFGHRSQQIIPDVDGSIAVPTACHEFDSLRPVDCYCRFDPETLEFISYSEHSPANRSAGRNVVAAGFIWEAEDITYRLEVQGELDGEIVDGPFYLAVPDGASPVSRSSFAVVSTAVTWDERSVVGLFDGRALLVSDDLRSLTAIHHDYSPDAVVLSVLPSDPYRE